MDPIADMLTTLINAQKIGRQHVAIPYSQFKESLLAYLQERGFVAKVRLQESPRAKLVVTLAYEKNGSPRIHGIRRLSTPGGRKYASHTQMPYAFQGYGTVVISTSQGLMDERKARRQKVGGELICAIW